MGNAPAWSGAWRAAPRVLARDQVRVNRSASQILRKMESTTQIASRAGRSQAQSSAVRAGLVTLRPPTTSISSDRGSRVLRTSETSRPWNVRPSSAVYVSVGRRRRPPVGTFGTAIRMSGSAARQVYPCATAAASCVRHTADGCVQRGCRPCECCLATLFPRCELRLGVEIDAAHDLDRAGLDNRSCVVAQGGQGQLRHCWRRRNAAHVPQRATRWGGNAKVHGEGCGQGCHGSCLWSPGQCARL